MNLDADDPTWSELLSHPADGDREAVALETHLLGVARRARDATPPDAETADGRSLHDAAWVVGLAHDIGKATRWFQTHVDNDENDEGPSHHARLGGLLAYYALRTRGYGAGTCFAGLVAVAKHHGTLPDYASFVSEHLDQQTTWEFSEDDGARDASYNGAAARQAAHVEVVRPAFARAVTDELVGESGSWGDFLSRLTASNDGIETVGEDPDESILDWLRDDYIYMCQPDGDQTNDGATYVDELRLYGALTFADKTHAAGITEGDSRIEAEPLPVERVWAHIDGLGEDTDDEEVESRSETDDERVLEQQLNAVRTEVQRYIGGRSDRGHPIESFLEDDASVATLTLPTGYGKTLTGTLAAARVREASGGERIVYALPFTSVVDQTAEVLREVCGDEDGDPTLGRRLTVHHHLVEALTLSGEDGNEEHEGTDEDAGRATLLAEGWRAGVTLTTFVQLFESLAGPRNGQSTKLPALHESVVVVDEPQALPLTWWPLVERLIDALVTEFDATVILMTATQPRILDEDDTVSLLGSETLDAVESEAAPGLPDRVEYTFHPTAFGTGEEGSEPLGYDDAAAWLAEAAREPGSTLAVCNTIDSAATLVERVVAELDGDRREPAFVDVAAAVAEDVLCDRRVGDRTPEDERRDDRGESENESDREREQAAFARAVARRASPARPALVYLSTRLRPCDRQFLLATVENLIDLGVPLLVVSTQVVEAGVDLSFDWVVRDFAPLDSIVQAAGRCNRSFERAPDSGRVTVWRLDTPGERETVPGEAVYARRRGDSDQDLLSKTREALDGVPVDEPVAESRIAQAGVESYHEAVGDAVDAVAADNGLVQAFDDADGTELRRASLIDDELSFEVYVCRTDAEYDVVEAYRKAEKAFEFEEVDNLRNQLAPLRVSVPVYDRTSDAARKLIDLEPLSLHADKQDATERVLQTDHDPRFFDARTGTDVPEDTVEGRFF